MSTRRTSSTPGSATVPRPRKRVSRRAETSEEWLTLGAEFLRTATSGSRAADERLALSGLQGLRSPLS